MQKMEIAHRIHQEAGISEKEAAALLDEMATFDEAGVSERNT